MSKRKSAAPAAVEEPSFVRGKARPPPTASSLIHPHLAGGVKAVLPSRDDDVLFGSKSKPAKEVKPASRKKSRPAAILSTTSKNKIHQNKELSRADLLTFRKLRVGMQLLG